MPAITPEQRQAIERAGGEPARLIDPASQVSYVLLRAEDYERLQAASSDSAQDWPAVAYPLIDEVFGKSGWDDTRMDEYNDYESRRP